MAGRYISKDALTDFLDATGVTENFYFIMINEHDTKNFVISDTVLFNMFTDKHDFFVDVIDDSGFVLIEGTDVQTLMDSIDDQIVINADDIDTNNTIALAGVNAAGINSVAITTLLPLAGGTMTGAILGNQAVTFKYPLFGDPIVASTTLSALTVGALHRVDTTSGTVTITISDDSAGTATGSHYKFIHTAGANPFEITVSGSQSVISVSSAVSSQGIGSHMDIYGYASNAWNLTGDIV